MPGIFVRDGYLESRRVAALFADPAAERFYFHLLIVADENGTFDADPIILRNRCFPAIEGLRTSEVEKWIAECVDAGLLRIFTDADGKKRIEVLRHEPPARKRNATIPTADTGDPDDADSVLPFAEFWTMYGKKVERAKCMRKYAAISESDRAEIRKRLPAYVAATPDVQFRKNPQTYLNGRCWMDEDLPIHGSRSEVTSEQRRRKGF